VALTSGTIDQISSKFKTALEIHVEIDRLSNRVIGNLRKIAFIDEVLRDGKFLYIKLKTKEDVRSKVFQTITSAGGIILSISVKGGNLEAVFLSLLSERKEGKEWWKINHKIGLIDFLQ